MADLTVNKPSLGENDYAVKINNLIDQLQATETEVSGSSGTYSTLSDRLANIDSIITLPSPVSGNLIRMTSTGTLEDANVSATQFLRNDASSTTIGNLTINKVSPIFQLQADTSSSAASDMILYMREFDGSAYKYRGALYWQSSTGNLVLRSYDSAGVASAARVELLNDSSISIYSPSVNFRSSNPYLNLVSDGTGDSRLQFYNGTTVRGICYWSAASDATRLLQYNTTGTVACYLDLSNTGRITIPSGYLDLNNTGGFRINNVSVLSTANEFNYLSSASPSNSTANKAAILDANSNLGIANTTSSSTVSINAASGFNSYLALNEAGVNSGLIYTSSANNYLGIRKYDSTGSTITAQIGLLETGQITISSGYIDFEASRSNFRIDGTTVTASAAELNVLDSPDVARVYLNTSITGIVSTAFAQITYDLANFDRNSVYDSSTGRFQPSKDGLYRIEATTYVLLDQDPVGGDVVNISFIKNSTLYSTYLHRFYAGSTNNRYITIQFSDLIQLNGTTEYITVSINFSSSSGGTMQIVAGTDKTFASLIRVP